MANASDWQETLDDLDRRRRHTLGMGGNERVAKHHAKGKLDVRARLDRLLRDFAWGRMDEVFPEIAEPKQAS